MVVQSLILIEGKNIEDKDLMNMTLQSVKPSIVGRIHTLGIILYLVANSAEDYNKAFLDYSALPNITGIHPLMIKKGW